jgi:UDP-N-acetyl-2-amino-2-deoxyglucuronate dehydrogenase
MRKKNFAIIGKGFIYDRHVKAIKHVGGKVVLTCDIDPNKKADFTDWVLMYNSPEFEKVDVVVICAPNYLHGVMAREARARNKQVICEKPLCIDTVNGMYQVYSVLQLRHHPALQRIKKGNIEVDAKMYRDDVYWDSWKGDDAKSGGIIYNLGIHYLDIMIFLLGEPTDVEYFSLTKKRAIGIVRFGKFIGKFNIQIVDSKKEQGRSLKIRGKEINLSNKENLSYEDLHKRVYEDFMIGRGSGVRKASRALSLIRKLKAWRHNVETTKHLKG